MTLTSEVRLEYEDFMQIATFLYKQGCQDGANAVLGSVSADEDQLKEFRTRWEDVLNMHVEKVEMNIRDILITNGIVEDLT